MKGGLLRAVDVYRSNQKSKIQKMADKWYDAGYFVEYQYQADKFDVGEYVLTAFIVDDKKKIF